MGNAFATFISELDLTTAERQFIQDANTAVTADMNQSQALMAIYLVRNFRAMTEQMVHSADRVGSIVMEAGNQASKEMMRASNKVAHALDGSSEKIIAGSKDISDAGSAQSRRLVVLTGLLVVIGLLQAITAGVQAYAAFHSKPQIVVQPVPVSVQLGQAAPGAPRR